MIDSTLLLLVILALAADVVIVWYRRRAKHRANSRTSIAPNHSSLVTRQPHRFTFDTALFSLTALLFFLTRLIALERWPIYFFTDEAVNAVRAAELLSNGLRDAHDVFLPTYFQNGLVTSLSTSVYAQVIPTALFGLSMFVTRTVVVLITLSGTLAVGLILRDAFKVRFWWIGSLLLSITPAWFLHSRTAFEHPLWVSFFAWFIYFYLRYRLDRPRHLLTALLCGALSFYAYNGGQLGVVLTGLLLLIVDARYHVHTLRTRPRLLIAALVVFIIVVAPYARFYADNSAEINQHLRLLDSYWTQSLSFSEKLGRLLQEYWNGLRPDDWFASDNTRDLIRHQMKGYAQLPLYLLPFFSVGLAIVLKKARLAPQRTLLIALLIAPAGGVLVSAYVLRILVFVVPAALLSALGLIALLEIIGRRVAYRSLALGAGALLASINLIMLIDATTNGPTWYDNYGLTGLQYGGPQVFAEAQRLVNADPQRKVWIASTWLNGPEVLKAFFAPTEPHIQLFDLNAVVHERYDIDALTLVLNRDDYQRVIDSGKFTVQSVESTLPYPDGTPGFTFARLSYSPQADGLFAAESEARSKLLSETIEWQGQPLMIAHSRLDIGSIDLLYDGDPATLIRTQEVNPAIIELIFTTPVAVSGVAVATTSPTVTLAIDVTTSDQQSLHFEQSDTGLSPDSTVKIDFGAPLNVTRLRLTLHDPQAAPYANLHLREVEIKP
ncbi:MAG: hypothetical protein HY870_03635 [Chloroflexi bacterium]|nr:hypothetical protein [Chloroflexota bacterium]